MRTLLLAVISAMLVCSSCSSNKKADVTVNQDSCFRIEVPGQYERSILVSEVEYQGHTMVLALEDAGHTCAANTMSFTHSPNCRCHIKQ